MSLKVSKENGVNPSMDVCFFCGEPKELLLLGRLPGDKKAPREVCTNMEPCDACKEKFKEGILLIEVNNKQATGRYWLVRREVINNEEILKLGKALITVQDARSMGLYQEQ